MTASFKGREVDQQCNLIVTGDYIWSFLSPYVMSRLANLQSTTIGRMQDANIILRPYRPALKLSSFKQPFRPLSVNF